MHTGEACRRSHRMTMLLHSSLYLSMPMAMTSLLVLMPAHVQGQFWVSVLHHCLPVVGAQAVKLDAFRTGRLRTESLVDLMLHWQAVTVPPAIALRA